VVRTMGEGMDLEYFHPFPAEERAAARARWGIPVQARVVGFVGRLIREKGALDFLRLCQSLGDVDDLYFLVVGDPDPGNPTSLAPDEMRALEAVPRLRREPWIDDVRPAYAAMDKLVFLSAREGLPVSPLEAMASGVPVWAYDGVGTREAVPECWRVRAGDWEGLAACLRGFVAGAETEKARDAVATCGRDRAGREFLERLS